MFVKGDTITQSGFHPDIPNKSKASWECQSLGSLGPCQAVLQIVRLLGCAIKRGHKRGQDRRPLVTGLKTSDSTIVRSRNKRRCKVETNTTWAGSESHAPGLVLTLIGQVKQEVKEFLGTLFLRRLHSSQVHRTPRMS